MISFLQSFGEVNAGYIFSRVILKGGNIGMRCKGGGSWTISILSMTPPQELSLVDLPGGYTYFKFEPFVLHCMCLTLEDAQRMVGWSASFKQSPLHLTSTKPLSKSFRLRSGQASVTLA